MHVKLFGVVYPFLFSQVWSDRFASFGKISYISHLCNFQLLVGDCYWTFSINTLK